MLTLTFDITTFCIYVFALLMWFYLWGVLVGYNWLYHRPLLFIAFIGAPFVFTVNILLSFYSAVLDYDSELAIYSYVEQNAKTVASFSMAIAIFVVVRFDKEVGVLQKPSSRKFLWLIFWSFLFALVGCLPLYWMPPIDEWLRVLRHIKTVPFTYSLFILSSGIIIFLYDTQELSSENL